MKDIVLCCCRDEEDLIESFIAFYFKMGFDAVFVVDNGSTDRTGDLLAEIARTDDRVYVRRDPRIGYERFLGEYYAWAGALAKPRWIFFLDCDEFILFPEGAKQFLTNLNPAVNCLRLRQRQMYPLLNGTPGTGRFLLTTRCSPDFDDTTKDVSCFRPDARLYAGKHRIDFPGRHEIVPQGIHIRHYKYRSQEQARRKERNRVESHRTYTDRELRELSAFGVDVLETWIRHCRDFERSEGWKTYFSTSATSAEDSDMADWASSVLLPELSFEPRGTTGRLYDGRR